MQAFLPLFPLESVVYIVVSSTYSTKLVRALLCLTSFCDFSSSILKNQFLSLMNIKGFHDLSPSSLVHFVSLLSLTHSQWFWLNCFLTVSQRRQSISHLQVFGQADAFAWYVHLTHFFPSCAPCKFLLSILKSHEHHPHVHLPTTIPPIITEVYVPTSIFLPVW